MVALVDHDQAVVGEEGVEIVDRFEALDHRQVDDPGQLASAAAFLADLLRGEAELQARALAALDALSVEGRGQLVFPASDGGHFDLHNFRNRHWQPAQEAAGIEPLRRIYDLRHTFATLCASCGDLHVRSLPLHGRELDDDRPPLRPPRPRRTRARHPAPGHPLQSTATSTAWTSGGR